MAAKTRKDYEEEAMLKNWATAQPGHYYSGAGGMGQYTGWNGGSVSGADMMAAINDSLRYGYDIQLDPRNGANDAINDLLTGLDLKANKDAINGIGEYETNRQNYLNQVGWTGYQDAFRHLQEEGNLGLTTLDGKTIEEAYGLGNPNYGKAAPAQSLSAEQLAQMQANEEYRNYVAGMLSPMMQGGSQKTAGGPWSYNKETDPVWQAYLNQYTRGGEKAMNDAMAQLSARTGGMASTYAGQVAQQTMNDYMKGATDVIPQLAEQDYDRWLTDKQMAIDAEQRQYERQMAAEQMQYERQMAQQQLAADQQAQNANLLLSLMESYGYMPSAEELAAAGLTQGVADAIGTAYQNNLALQWAKSNKSGGSGGGGVEQPTGNDVLFSAIYNSGARSGAEALPFLMSLYEDPEDLDHMMGLYERWATTQLSPDEILAGATDYTSAVSALEQLGMDDDVIRGLMDRESWHQVANSPSSYKNGYASNANANYKNYAEYLRAYLQWALEAGGL